MTPVPNHLFVEYFINFPCIWPFELLPQNSGMACTGP
jgi:hypothetical protein